MNKQNNTIEGELTLENTYVRENNEEDKYRSSHYQKLIVPSQIW